MRTLEDITADVDIATSTNDAQALLRLADELDELGTLEATSVAHNARGRTCFSTGNYTAALEHFNSALAFYHELGDRGGVAGAIGNIANVCNSTGDYPAALDQYNRAQALYHELGNRSGMAKVSANIGTVYMSIRDYPAALENCNRALALYHELNKRSGVANVTGNIGFIYSATGDYPAALEHFNKALELDYELGNRRGVASASIGIGSVYVLTGDYLAALEYYHKALSLCQEVGDRIGVARITSNIGYTYSQTGDHLAALGQYNSSLALHQELGAVKDSARVTGNILQAFLRNDNVDQARQTLATLDKLQIEDPSVVIVRETGRAMLHVLDSDMQAAQTTLASALDLAKTHGLRSEQADLFKELRDLAQKRNDFAAYVEYNNEYTRITEEIRGADAKLKIAMQAKEREIAEKDKETAKQIAVLHSTLPKHIADRVARGEVVNDHYDNAAVLFLDIVGFTSISDRIPAGHVVHLLDQIFTALDVLCDKHDVTKIKTIGDSYMAAGFEGNTSERMAACALDMLSTLNDMEIKMPAELGDASWTNDVGDIRVRIGLHVGPVTAGVIGTQRMQYDVWGDTVNVASRMESSSEAGRVHVSEAFVINLKSNTEYRVQNSIKESENSESSDSSLVTSHLTSHSSPVTSHFTDSSLLTSHLTSHSSPVTSHFTNSSLVTSHLTSHSSPVTSHFTDSSLLTSHFTHFSLQLRGEIDIKGKGLMTTYWLEQM